LQTATAVGCVLAIFVAVDLWFYRRDRRIELVGEPPMPAAIRIRGSVNLVLIALIIGAILLSATWRSGIAFDVYGTPVALETALRGGALVIIALISLVLTPDEHREANGFSWEPIREVAYLFAGIFVSVIPVLAALQAGRSGPFGWLLAAVTGADGSPQ